MPAITGRLSQFLGGGRQRNPNSGSDVAKVADKTSILDAYVHAAPSGQAALQIFDGEWSSKLPPPYDKVSGSSELFQDARIEWMLEVLGGVKGLRVLELGPLEAGHTCMLERAGATPSPRSRAIPAPS